MNNNKPVSKEVNKFFKNTTLHGFKYLVSKYFFDRLCWVVCCCASTCCAGMLCAVLWARFLEKPALLAMPEMLVEDIAAQRMPTVAVCPTTESIVEMFVDKLSTERNLTKRLPITVARALDGKAASKDQLETLDKLLNEKNLTIAELMFTHMPSCSRLLTKCRCSGQDVPCEQLFKKEFMGFGICCVMRTEEKLHEINKKYLHPVNLHVVRRLDLAMRCSAGPTLHGCLFYTQYDGEDWVIPMMLTQGYNYIAQLKFRSTSQSSSSEKLVEESCVPQSGYSRSQCLSECAEQMCGCIDPLRAISINLTTDLPPCSISQLTCLRTRGIRNNISCVCLPSCKQVASEISWESSPMNFIKYSIDPIYEGINVTSSVVLRLRVNINQSLILTVKATETWLTLLSSLGGVFNMFLGIGVFSAVEFILFIFVKLPMAFRKSSKIVQPSILK